MKAYFPVLIPALVAALCLPAASSGDSVAVVRAWQELEYGMLIHYGMSTFTGGILTPPVAK